jgi:hypothetical protein
VGIARACGSPKWEWPWGCRPPSFSEVSLQQPIRTADTRAHAQRTRTRTHTHAQTERPTHAHACARTHAHAHTRTHTHARTHTRAHAHAHTRMRTHAHRPDRDALRADRSASTDPTESALDVPPNDWTIGRHSARCGARRTATCWTGGRCGTRCPHICAGAEWAHPRPTTAPGWGSPRLTTAPGSGTPRPTYALGQGSPPGHRAGMGMVARPSSHVGCRNRCMLQVACCVSHVYNDA